MTLEELKKLCESATPGPWLHDWSNWDIESRHADHFRTEICSQPLPGMDEAITDIHSDMEFIAAARTYLPKALAIIEKAGLSHRLEE